MRTYTSLLAISATACAAPPCDALQWGYAVENGLVYDVGASETSPDGITHDGGVGATIDRLTSEVSACLHMSIDRTAFVVKVPSTFIVSDDGTQQELTATAPGSGCDAKGLVGDQPCRWRALIQCPNVIVATPSLYLYKDALIRWVTDSKNPWGDPVLAKCAAPTTDPLAY